MGVGRAIRISGLAAIVAAFAFAPSANAAITCTFNVGAGTLTAQGANGDVGEVAVGAGDAVQVFDRAISDSTPVACGGDPGPTVANTDFVNLSDVASGANVVWQAENPERWTAGANETEVIVAPGSGSDAFVLLDSNSTADIWALGANGLDWNNSGPPADVDVAFVGAVDQLVLLDGEGDNIIIANPIGLGGPFSGSTRLDVRGGSGGDFLAGGNTDDELFGGGGADNLFGIAGADILQGGAGTNQLDGGDGVDRAEYIDSTVGVTVDLNLTGPQSTGFSTDTLSLIEGANGSPQGDALIGNDGANPLDGFTGDDVLDGRGGNDSLDGGGGTDTATYAQASAGVTVDLSAAPGTATGGAGSDTLTELENLIGSPFADGLTGDALPNSITGLAGNDAVSALGGPDSVNVRDGGPDTASCGSEIDTAVADRASVDVVNADCETVDFLPEPPTDGGGGGGGGTGGGDGGGAGDGATPPTRKLTLAYSKRTGKFKGRLSSEQPACASGRVTVFEKVRRKGRPARAKKVGADRTNGAGKWSFREQGADGKFLAKVPSEQVAAGTCPAARSKLKRVG